MLKLFGSIGEYFMLLGKTFQKPQKMKVFMKLFMREINDLGVNSFGLVLFTSIFVGAVVAIQMYNNFSASSFPIPNSFIGYATKVVLILEFSPTIVSVILAGKVGSYIASSIGTMRVTEQIDALDIMGVNSPNFLILPKVVASILFNPLLIAISIVFGIVGGYWAGELTGNWTRAEYITGIQMYMPTYFIWYAFFKTAVFAFLIATIPAYFGYTVKGGSLEVGRASTQAVVWTIVSIIIANLILTQLFLS
ncbi:ABC transporter permease [Elizabethkingia meningoseptica]|uniref:MlaE family ABC transporter permease n=1 Tax=Elizabethkingia meningoseptica TaxID=238 RepID=UPI000332C538|nr:ABC transporter permease [Elizabethkingia meningoseptica]AQX04512.1 ABC transporter permease [Elizabethkingia meningoseptica]AQX46554.1 ABC transporter permease [Elizabethkingia meningoseptica]EOR31485.1 ABC-type transport system protein [Elizabethkingia meningoseptica ATCC 13253 = NBRC 12535]KUY19069.1 ABC transporter permease [Elizabethkingia meningoseptica]MCL1677083.1 ABC transporter permease [Elizabethkingia meningoseptica]